MLGFIKGLFGSTAKTEVQGAIAPVKKAKPTNSKSKEFFLEPDDAKTFGNIDYMRTAKTVRRTFPKTAGNGGEFEVVQTVSAMGAMSAKEDITPSPQASPATPSPSTATGTETGDRRLTDTSMDMFRQMAKGMKKQP